MGRRPSSAEVPQKQQLLLRRKPQQREQQVFGSRLRSMQGPVQDSSHRSRRSATLSPALSKRTSPRVQVDATPSSAKAPKSTERKSKRPSKSVKKEEINGEEELVGIIDGHDASSGRVEEDTKKEESAEIEAEENAQGQAEGDANGEAEEENESDEEDYEEEEESEGDGVGEVLGEGFYEVETVRRKRVRKGQVQYLIKWRGWPESANTWEPYDNVKACADIIEDFEKSHMVKQTRRGRGKRKLGTYLSPQDKGTYTSPQMKKRSSTSNGAKGSSATNTGKEPEGPGNGVEKQATEVPAAISEIPAIQAVADPTVSIGKESQAKINIFTGNKSNSGSGEVDLDQVALAFEEGSKSEGSQVKLTVSSLPKDCVMANVITSEEEMQSGPSFATFANRELSQKTHSKEETKSPSSFTSAETAMVCLAESSVPNGICDAKEESHVAEVAQLERQRLSAADLVMRETKTSTKKLTNHSATPGTEKRASEPAGKTTSDDKYTGAKKRKQGFVRRVRQSLDSQEHEMKQRPIEEGEKESQQIFEESNVVNNGEAVIQEGDGSMLKATNQQGHQSSHFEQIQAPQDSDMPPSQVPPSLPLDTGTTFQITEIVKAVSYSNSMANGKQDASVLFKVLRSDGQESMVDNKFLRANHPLLLIDFYEQHLRYSTSQ